MSITCLRSNISICSKLILFTGSKHVSYFLGLHVQITEQKTDNDVSKFTHSNWIMLSYYSSPKHKSLILDIWYTPWILYIII